MEGATLLSRFVSAGVSIGMLDQTRKIHQMQQNNIGGCNYQQTASSQRAGGKQLGVPDELNTPPAPRATPVQPAPPAKQALREGPLSSGVLTMVPEKGRSRRASLPQRGN